MTQQTRSLLDNELNTLNTDVLQLGSMVDTAIGSAVEALMTMNVALANEVIAGDAEINQLRFRIEEQAYVVLSTQQPMARDLRTVIAAIHFAIELERIGDHAAGIARIVTRLDELPTRIVVTEVEVTEEAPPAGVVVNLRRLPKMSKRAREMLSSAIDAFIERDVDKANAIMKRDRKLDRHYHRFFAEAMATMTSETAAEIPTYLLWIAHNLERIGDRTTNLAERVIFMVTGQYTEVLEDYE